MKYLHLKVAKRLCREQWAWYVDNLDKNKRNWPKKEEIEEEYGQIEDDCFFCHYVFQGRGKGCDACPFRLKYGHWCLRGPHPYISDPVGFNAMIQAIK